MISRIRGKILERTEQSLILDVGGIGYEILVPAGVLCGLEPTETAVQFLTYHYLQNEPSRSIPVLIGFLNAIEKEFFEKFITVSGIGPKAAVRALSEPFSTIARAIDGADVAFLKSLPGIGQQRAREIVAKLQNKVAKFALLPIPPHAEPPATASDMQEEALNVLMQLQYKQPEAEKMIQLALSRNPALHNVEELLNEVYRQKIKS